MGTFNSLQTTTIREFDGGLNVVTDDLNMSTAYSTIETNVFNNINGTKSIRYGTKLFRDFKDGIRVVYPEVDCTTVTQYKYKFEQPISKIPVGTEVSVYLNSTDINPSLVGTVYMVDENYFYIYSYTTDLSISPNTTVYLEYTLLEVQYTLIETKFIQKNSNSRLMITLEDFPVLKYLYIGNIIKINDTNTKIVDIDTKNGYYYFNYTTSDTSVSAYFYFGKISGTRFVNGTYFIDKLVLVSDIGEVCLVDGEGFLSIVFDSNIDQTINTEVRDYYGWHTTTNVCFTVFNGILTIWNGRDKPLALDLNNSKIPCNYLLDTGTMSNSFVPRAKYAISFNHYLVCGNVYDEIDGKDTFLTDRLCISARDSIGTFYTGLSTDVDNDAVNVDLGTIISSNGQVIKGLSRYRNQLVVGFDDVTVFGTLGEYVETEQEQNGVNVTIRNHNPKFDDVIDRHGCISNRTYETLSSSLICLDYSGIPDFSRRNITASVIPSRISELIAPEIYKNYINLTENTIENRIFAVNNPKENQYLLFIPNNDNYSETTETVCYAYTLRSKVSRISDGAWSKFTGWNFDYGITSALNTVFLGKGTKIYILGSIDNPYYADYIDDPLYSALNDEDVPGKAINFEWELPWADFGDRAAIKKSRYLALSTTGYANFNVDIFVDYIYTNKETGELTPSLSMDFVAGDSYGYGDGNNFTTIDNNIVPDVIGNQRYGGGRRTNTELLFAWTTKFKIAKFRISGSSKYKLNINSLTLYYLKGNIRR